MSHIAKQLAARSFLLLICAYFPAFSFSSAAETFSGTTMGTIRYNVTVDATAGSTAAIEARISKRLAEINGWMSTYDPESEVSRFNASDHTDWFSVSRETAVVVEESLRLHHATGGTFDITVGPLVNLWGFGPAKKNSIGAVPGDDVIAAALAVVGSSKLAVRLDPPAIKKENPELQIDLSAIAKGYAVDQVAELLIENGFESFLVEIGGEVRAGKAKADGSHWRVGIEAPVIGDRDLQGIVELENQSLASSGNYRNYFDLSGARYSHIIDSRTGRPATVGIAAASVIAENCMLADALATAAMVLGTDATKRISKDLNCDVLTIGIASGANDPEIFQTPGFHLLPAQAAADRTAQTSGDGASFWPVFIGVAAMFLIVMTMMSIGAIFAGNNIKGSCGALASSGNAELSSPCDLCSKPVSDCPEKRARAESAVD